MTKTVQKIVCLLGGVGLLCLPVVLMAQTPGDHDGAHDHHHDSHAATLSLDHGHKWQTDAPLRQGMQSIRDAALPAVAAFHADRLSQAEATRLAAHIRAQVDYLVANCKLEPRADASLHALIGELLQGADVLAREPLSMQGLPRIIQTLRVYPDYFEHPGWLLHHE
ncbi:MAG: hypothetical protein R6X06_06255 [Gammaproteobacteria bacterium]